MQIASSNSRLKELLKIFGDTQADMVRKTGIEKSAISNYINGKREARQDKLILIANAYNVNPGWLMGLDVPMNNKSDLIEERSDNEKSEHDPEVVAKAMDFYKRYESLPPEMQKEFQDYLAFLQSKSAPPQ